MIWRFVDESNNIIEPINKSKTKSNKSKTKLNKIRTGRYKCKPIICLTTKKIFRSLADAKRFYNIKGNSAFSDYFKKNKKHCGTYNGQKLQWALINIKHNKKYKIKRC